MTSSLAVIAIDAVNPDLIAGFWCAVLGWTRLGQDDDGVISIGPADGRPPTIDVSPVPERKSVNHRLHFDL